MNSISKIDLNFTNGGGGHTASVTCVEGSKSVQTTSEIGEVGGILGEVNLFSNTEIDSMLSNFICTQISTSAGPTKKTIVKRFVDRTSLALESFIVLVRGMQCGPEGGKEFEGPVPFFTEVVNSPLRSYKVMDPIKVGSTIEAGKIYNYESASKYDGTKMGLVYNNKKLVRDLCLNLDFVSDSYEQNPDLAQFDLKYGYTIREFQQMLALANIDVQGLPETHLDTILFTTSGTLKSVVSSVASYLGNFWYVDPATGSVKFINTEDASSIPITNYTSTTDANITAASYTESKTATKIVNTYAGTTEKKEAKSREADGIREKPTFFKRVFIEQAQPFKDLLSVDTLGVFFALFNQNVDQETFDEYCYLMTWFQANKWFAKWGLDEFDINKEKLYPYAPRAKDKYFKFQAAKDPKIWSMGAVLAPQEAKLTKLKGKNRITDQFRYVEMMVKEGPAKMPPPSKSELHRILKTYFAIAGGVYISNGFTKYKVERMDFTNNNNVTIVGPFKGSKKLHTIDELSELSDIFELFGANGWFPTIKQLAEITNGEAETTHNYFYMAIRNLPALERVNNKNCKPVDFEPFDLLCETYEPATKNLLFVGGPRKFFRNMGGDVRDMAIQSCKNFKAAIKVKKTLKLKYNRSKTRVNKISEEGEEDEDDKVAESSEGDQKKSDLFDRFDLKYFNREEPTWQITNKLSLASASGTTSEMKLLRDVRGPYVNAFDSPNSSSRTLYGLHIPEHTPVMNSISISRGPSGITTTINESSIKLIPPSDTLLVQEGQEARAVSNVPINLSAAQRNALGL